MMRTDDRRRLAAGARLYRAARQRRPLAELDALAESLLGVRETRAALVVWLRRHGARRAALVKRGDA